MFDWSWLEDIDIFKTVCVLSGANKEEPQKHDYWAKQNKALLKALFVDIIERGSTVFIVSLETEFQVIVGKILLTLKNRYRGLKIIVIGYGDLSTLFSGEYLHIAWQLQGEAYKFEGMLIDDAELCNIKREVTEYLRSLNTILVTPDIDLSQVKVTSMERSEKTEQSRTVFSNHTIPEYNQPLSYQSLTLDNDDMPLDDDDSTIAYLLETRKALRRRINDTLRIISKLEEQVSRYKASVDNDISEFQALENKLHQINSNKKAEKDIHRGLYNKRVLWPVGYCKYHNCGLDEVDIKRRRCIIRKGRKGICFHFDFLDENGNQIACARTIYSKGIHYHGGYNPDRNQILKETDHLSRK